MPIHSYQCESCEKEFDEYFSTYKAVVPELKCSCGGTAKKLDFGKSVGFGNASHVAFCRNN